MKVLHVIAGSLNGGASKGALSLHESLLNKEIESRVLTNSISEQGLPLFETTRTGKITGLKTQLLSVLSRLPLIVYPRRERTTFSTGFFGFDIRKFESYKSADIIHLHWVSAGLLSLRNLDKINKPIVWTLRDMWPMTGGCHYSLQCKQFMHGCGNCPQLNSNCSTDLSSIAFRLKLGHYPSNMELVSTSEWIKQNAKRSPLLRRYNISTIHNGIDTNRFYPVKKTQARKQLNIPPEATVILFGAINVNDIYKGFKYFLEAVSKLKNANLYILLFGQFDVSELREFHRPFKSLGLVSSIDQLRLVYSSADAFVAPAIAEAFGKTTAESQACGTPVVCFDDFGQKDIVDHKITGYRAITLDTADLASGIDWVINDESRHRSLCIEARKRAVTHFDVSQIAEKYIAVYERLYSHANASNKDLSNHLKI